MRSWTDSPISNNFFALGGKVTTRLSQVRVTTDHNLSRSHWRVKFDFEFRNGAANIWLLGLMVTTQNAKIYSVRGWMGFHCCSHHHHVGGWASIAVVIINNNNDVRLKRGGRAQTYVLMMPAVCMHSGTYKEQAPRKDAAKTSTLSLQLVSSERTSLAPRIR